MKYINFPRSKKAKFFVRYTKNLSDKDFCNGEFAISFKDAKRLYKSYLRKIFFAYVRMKMTKPNIDWTYVEAAIENYHKISGYSCRTKMKGFHKSFFYRNKQTQSRNSILDNNSMELNKLYNGYEIDMSNITYTRHIARVLADVKGIDKTNLRPKLKHDYKRTNS